MANVMDCMSLSPHCHYPYICECHTAERPDEDFAEPGGNSSLRRGVRNQPCPTCGEENVLTEKDVALGYQCNDCADRAEGGGY